VKKGKQVLLQRSVVLWYIEMFLLLLILLIEKMVWEILEHSRRHAFKKFSGSRSQVV